MYDVLYAVAGVSAEWVDEHFTSLRVTLPEGGTYRISYSSVNKGNVLAEAMLVTAGSTSLAVMDLSPDHFKFYTILVEVGNDKGKRFLYDSASAYRQHLTYSS